ncbi:hypothetical protein ACS0TY_017473 [Phlomoides rotata]
MEKQIRDLSASRDPIHNPLIAVATFSIGGLKASPFDQSFRYEGGLKAYPVRSKLCTYRFNNLKSIGDSSMLSYRGFHVELGAREKALLAEDPSLQHFKSPKKTALEDHVKSVRDDFAEALGALLALGMNPDAQRVVPVLAKETAEDLAARVLHEEHKLYVEVCKALCEERITWREDGVPLIQSKENPCDFQ